MGVIGLCFKILEVGYWMWPSVRRFLYTWVIGYGRVIVRSLVADADYCTKL